jgi:hypothetical protein
LARTSSAALQKHIHASLHEHAAICVLSNLSHSERGDLAKTLSAAWADVQGKHVRKLRQLQLSLPWSEKAALSVFNKFIDLLGIARIRAAISHAHEELRDFQSLPSMNAALLRIANGNTFIAEVLSLLEDNPDYMYSEWERKMRPQALRSFITDSCPRPTLNKLDIARNLTLEDRYLLLRSLWECLIGPIPTHDLDQHTRLWLWIDELENILDYTEKDQLSLIKGLTSLIASAGAFVTLWLNMSAQSAERVAAIKSLLGERLLSLVDDDWTAREEAETSL